MRPAVVAGLSLVILASTSMAQSATSSTFVITADRDTVAVERFTRSAATLAGDMRLVQDPRSLHVHYSLSLRADGSASRAEVIDDAPGFFTGLVVFDSTAMLAARAEVGSLNDRIRMAPTSSYPTIGTSMALMEQMARASHPAIGESVHMAVINIRNGNVAGLTIRRTAVDSVLIACDGCMRMGAREEIHAALNRNGDIVGGTNPALNWTITRR